MCHTFWLLVITTKTQRSALVFDLEEGQRAKTLKVIKGH